MENKALIGHTGFIGRNLVEKMDFTHLYNSKNIETIRNKEFDIVISCGNSSLKWYVNENKHTDLENILSFIEDIKTIKTKKFILISTIDVYENPLDVTEMDEANCTENKPYGNNRLILENFVRSFFDNYLIIRLPIVYGKYFSKNFIFDILNNKEVDKINGNSIVQIYNVENLVSDMNIFLGQKLNIVNLATEPLTIKELFPKFFDTDLFNISKNNSKTNMITTFNGNKKYFYQKEDLISELNKFIEHYETKCVQHSLESKE